MLESTQSSAGTPGHGFPHLAVIKESIKLLYKHLSPQRIKSFSRSLSPSEAAMANGGDIVIAVQSLAGVIVRHLQLPKACIIVTFRDMEDPGRVELTPKDDYLVDLQNKYRTDHRDIAAVLAHEVTHVFLHRHGIQFPDSSENELLTDTAAVYLGIGWLCLNAYRVTVDRQERYTSPDMREVRTTTTEERPGYLTPEEFGYVLRKRAFAFGEMVDSLITSPAAKSALDKGSRLAVVDHRSAPVVGCSWWRRWGYCWNRRYIRNVHRNSGLTGFSRQFSGYRFEVSDSMRVILECPVCSQQLRLPTDRRVVARCGVCETSIECNT
ncbi:MAG: hypothetical protein AB1486_30360 [Planctomycetota bacterium]